MIELIIKFCVAEYLQCQHKNEHLSTLTELKSMLNNLNNISSKQIILGRYLKFHLGSLLEAKVGNPVFLKKKSVATMIDIKQALDLCDNWKVRNRKSTRFTFPQNHVKGYIERRREIFVAYIPHESISKTDITASLSSDHSLKLVILKLD